MAKPSETAGFKSLLKEWNELLLRTGFADIEYTNQKDETLLCDIGGLNRYVNCSETERSARIQYFDRVSEQVQKTEFDNDEEREILTLYSQGVSQAEIKRKLSISGHRGRVYSPIYRWLKEWGLK